MRQSSFTAVYDACVLYPAALRDFLMWLALSGRFRAKWSLEIHHEWKRNVLKNRPDLSAEQLNRTSDLMDQALPDACVTGHEGLIKALTLPDADDRHVLAAAIRCHASVIVTFNEKDFPAEALVPFGIEAQHPDEFVGNLIDLDLSAVIAAAQRQRQQLKMPPMKVGPYLDLLSRQGLIRSSKALSHYRAIL
ncbi:PIN domain-containing protein [Pseudomonas sp. NPDC086278]|uniref:PIN domain-containing protein n=1 Tax=Pseudomonas sp. NPDC086278 TaxID=3390646 RepID=UPI003D0704AC